MRSLILISFTLWGWTLLAQKPVVYKQVQKGVASFYGPRFEGRKTANGEIFSNANLTAAHKTLPFNSIVKVTVAENKRYVFVRINDRGPFVKGRVIDLTDAATTGLDFKHAGTEMVELKLCDEIQLTEELRKSFSESAYHDPLGNSVVVKGRTISVIMVLSLEHALYIASDLYDDPALNFVAVKAFKVGKVTRYNVVIYNLENKPEELKALLSVLKNRGYVNARLLPL